MSDGVPTGNVIGAGNRHRGWYLTLFALGVATVATGGSLFYSEVWGLAPCRLCWYQRILMYPLVGILGVAVFYPGQDHAVGRFVLPLSVPGVGIAAYHSYLQATTATCSFQGPCAYVQFRLLGLLTIPNQALVGFVLITVATALVGIRRGTLDAVRVRLSGE